LVEKSELEVDDERRDSQYELKIAGAELDLRKRMYRKQKKKD